MPQKFLFIYLFIYFTYSEFKKVLKTSGKRLSGLEISSSSSSESTTGFTNLKT